MGVVATVLLLTHLPHASALSQIPSVSLTLLSVHSLASRVFDSFTKVDIHDFYFFSTNI